MSNHEAESGHSESEVKAFVAGWFAHARNPERLVVEDAWHAYRIGDLCPGCLRKPCECPVDDSAARAIFEVITPPGETLP